LDSSRVPDSLDNVSGAGLAFCAQHCSSCVVNDDGDDDDDSGDGDDYKIAKLMETAAPSITIITTLP